MVDQNSNQKNAKTGEGLAKPAQAQRRKTAGPRPASVPKKATDSLLGLFVLAFGLGAIMAVFYLGYVRFFAGPSQDYGSYVDEMSALSEAGDTYTGDGNEVGLRYPRLRDLQGKWQATVDNKLAYAIFYDDQFQLLYIYNDHKGEKKYGAGRFEYDPATGELELDANRAATDALVGESVRHSPMTRRDFKMQLIYDPDKKVLLWKPMEGSNRIHPMFFYMEREDSVIGWMKSKV